jgi:predicted branched-subunit amino acid permease
VQDRAFEVQTPTTIAWFLRGARAGFSLPGFILLSAFIGFGSLAREAGFSLDEALFMVLMVWALPSMVVLVGAVQAGAALPAAALAVTLSAVRLMPMVMALAPEMSGPRTRRWVLYVLSHFIAVTSWVMSLQQLPAVPREGRTSYYAGLASILMIANLLIVAVTYLLLRQLPPEAAAALLFLTPMYFLTSLWGAARERAGNVAMLAGVVLGPVFHVTLPEIDLLAAGLIGGGGAFAFHLITRRKAAR